MLVSGANSPFGRVIPDLRTEAASRFPLPPSTSGLLVRGSIGSGLLTFPRTLFPYLHKAIRTQGLPEKITIDKSGSNTAAITHYNKNNNIAIIMRKSKYLNNYVEQ